MARNYGRVLPTCIMPVDVLKTRPSFFFPAHENDYGNCDDRHEHRTVFRSGQSVEKGEEEVWRESESKF